MRLAREAKLEAAAVLASAEATLAAEEAGKAALVGDLNSLILQSTVQQFKALESLESRMDGLAARVTGPGEVAAASADGVAVTVATSSPRADGGAKTAAAGAPADQMSAARAEMEAAAAVAAAAAAEARGRHVARPRPGGQPRAEGGVKLAAGVAPAAPSSGGFSGFAV